MAAPRTLPGLLKRDFKSDTWERLATRIRAQLEIHRDELESRTNTEATTAALRGRISSLREILALERAPVDAPVALDDIVDRAQLTRSLPNGGM